MQQKLKIVYKQIKDITPDEIQRRLDKAFDILFDETLKNMRKPEPIRIFLKDKSGNLYRICSVFNLKDKKGEYYLKVMFPDIKNIPLLTANNTNGGVIKKDKPLERGIQEFSYHYRSGVSHFKDADGHIDQKKDKPTLFDFPALHLVRFIVRKLDPFEVKDDSKVSSTDLVIPAIFDGNARGFEFVVSHISGPWKVTNEAGADPVQTFKLPLEDTNVFLHISDSTWTRDPSIEKGKNTLFEIFRYEDPTTSFKFTPCNK